MYLRRLHTIAIIISMIFGIVISGSNTALSQSYTRSAFVAGYLPISVSTGATNIVSGSTSNQFSQSSGFGSNDDGTAYIPLPFSFS